jgi:hypothetical protein
MRELRACMHAAALLRMHAAVVHGMPSFLCFDALDQ